MEDHETRPPPVDDNVYEMPQTIEDMKREIKQGGIAMGSVVFALLAFFAVLYGIWHLHSKGMLVNPDSTEYSYLLTLIIFLPAVGIFFNLLAPPRGTWFVRINTLAYTLLTLILACVMLFGYSNAKTDRGNIIFLNQLDDRLTVRADGSYYSVSEDGIEGGKITFELDDYGLALVSVDGDLRDLKLAAVRVYFYDRSTADMQFEELRPWVSVTDKPAQEVGEAEYTIAKFQYHLGVDGISFPMILLTTLLCVIAVIASFNVGKRVKEYMCWFLLLEIGMLGTFSSLDYILFYVFWELVLVPMYFLIGIWGGPRKEYAALKFFLYTLFGSVFLLVGIIALYFLCERRTFDIIILQEIAPEYLRTATNFKWQLILFWCFFLSFAIKVPIFPFHTWLPDAHVEAPTAISILLAGVLLKMGTYGLLRMSWPTFPEAAYMYAPIIGVLAVINIVYGSLVAMAQTDMKKLVAYSSIAHMGFVLLGLASFNKYGMTGAQLQIINHGIISGSLFLLVGVLYDRAHTRDLNAFGGLLPQMRLYGIIMIIACLANLGLPGLAGFWGEFWSIMGAMQQTEFVTKSGLIFFRYLAPISLLGIIITAAYMLIMVRKVFMGPLNERWNWLPDINKRELVCAIPLVFLMIYIGIYPGPLISLFETSILNLVDMTRMAAGVPPVTF